MHPYFPAHHLSVSPTHLTECSVKLAKRIMSLKKSFQFKLAKKLQRKFSRLNTNIDRLESRYNARYLRIIDIGVKTGSAQSMLSAKHLPPNLDIDLLPIVPAIETTSTYPGRLSERVLSQKHFPGDAM